MNAGPVNTGVPLPWLGRAALWLCAPAGDYESIAGDLAEEYLGDRLPRFGSAQANRWYLNQVLHSAVPLMVSRWRRGELPGLLAAALVAIFAPLRIADWLWAFIHSQVPMKADLSWAAGIWIANLVIAMFAAAVLGYGARNLRSAAILAILGFGCAGVSVMMSTGHAPQWYVAVLLTATPFFCIVIRATRGMLVRS